MPVRSLLKYCDCNFDYHRPIFRIKYLLWKDVVVTGFLFYFGLLPRKNEDSGPNLSIFYLPVRKISKLSTNFSGIRVDRKDKN